MFMLSADDRDEAQAMADENDVPFAIGYDLDPTDIRRRFGSRLSDDETFVQPTGYIVDPDGVVVHSVYADGQIGRLHANETIKHIRFLARD